MPDDLVFNCLMCGTPLLIREQDRHERLQCPVCGEIMLASDYGMQLDPGENLSSRPKYNLFSSLLYGLLILGMLIVALFVCFLAICLIVPSRF